MHLLAVIRIIIFIVVSATAYTQNTFQHSSEGEIIKHSRYYLSYREDHEQAEWVCYKLNSNLVSGLINRSNNFREDYSVSTGSAKPSDYKYSGYDRGHLVPAGDMRLSYKAMSESFLMSNISPQNPSFNRGGWRKLEALVRNWANKNELHIVTGGVLSGELIKIGISGVSVPRYFYKIIYAPKKGKMIGFVMPNSKINLNLKSYVKSVDVIESLTGKDFFYDLYDDLENKLESKSDITDWNF